MPDSTERQKAMRALRIMATAITLGPAVFLAVVFVLLRNDSGPLGNSESAPLLSWLGLGLVVPVLAAHLLLPRLIRASAGPGLDGFRTMTIVRLAVTEGGALFGCVAYLLEGRETPAGAGVAIALVLFMAAAQFPREAGLDAWADGT